MPSVVEQAREEIANELFTKAVEQEKKRILAAKWWHKFVPFVVIIKRRK